MYSFPNLEPVHCSMSSSNCCFLTYIHVSQEAGKVVWYYHLYLLCSDTLCENIPQPPQPPTPEACRIVFFSQCFQISWWHALVWVCFHPSFRKLIAINSRKLMIIFPFLSLQFLATSLGIWDLSSPTRDQTYTPYSGSAESEPEDRQGSLWKYILILLSPFLFVMPIIWILCYLGSSCIIFLSLVFIICCFVLISRNLQHYYPIFLLNFFISAIFLLFKSCLFPV